jgi:hypothetical protein
MIESGESIKQLSYILGRSTSSAAPSVPPALVVRANSLQMSVSSTMACEEANLWAQGASGLPR